MKANTNNKCKAFTSLEQSRKLAEILPLESADMVIWGRNLDAVAATDAQRFMSGLKDRKMNYLPCWSLASLLGVLPEIQGGKPIIALDDNYITYPHISDLHTKADNLVDACVAMIEKLHELKML